MTNQKWKVFKVLGCDFGVPQKAGKQACKIILIEARKVGDCEYSIEPNGRNERLCRDIASDDTWPIDRRGWTLPDLIGSLRADTNVRVAAFDFPFSIPDELLKDVGFAEAIGHNTAFGTRHTLQEFLSNKIEMAFQNTDSQARLLGLSFFDNWRDRPDYWKKRQTDIAARGQPPLKNVGQNLFNMTLGGIAMLAHLEQKSLQTKLHKHHQSRAARFAVETYPAAVARAVEFAGDYKRDPVACMKKARNWLESVGVRVKMHPDVCRFCQDYRTPPDDPDGADAFLCLVTAIAVVENKVTWHTNGASLEVLDQEGCIVVPASDSRSLVTAAAEDGRHDMSGLRQSSCEPYRAPRGQLSADQLRGEQQGYQARYPDIHFVRDSLQNSTGEPGDEFQNKRSIQFVCREPGCGVLRRVATSDLHNTKGYCREHAQGRRR